LSDALMLSRVSLVADWSAGRSFHDPHPCSFSFYDVIPENSMFSNILVPIDTDDPEVTARIVDVAKAFANSHEASLTVVSVAPDPRSSSADTESGSQKKLEDLLAAHGEPGEIRGVHAIRSSVFSAIQSAAREIGIDLILLGSRDPRLAERLLGPELADTAHHSGISLDRDARQVRRNGTDIHLGPTEFRLLECLLARPHHVFSRDELLIMVWGNDGDVALRTVDVHVGRLRKALNHHDEPDPIRTVRSVGYALGSGITD
jgi:DNA-binding winged helix-turn-helix (wHTH) protein